MLASNDANQPKVLYFLGANCAIPSFCTNRTTSLSKSGQYAMFLRKERQRYGTYALLAVAVRKVWSMWKSSNRSWERMTEGRKTPEATRLAPKATPVNNFTTMVEGRLERRLKEPNSESRDGFEEEGNNGIMDGSELGGRGGGGGVS